MLIKGAHQVPNPNSRGARNHDLHSMNRSVRKFYLEVPVHAPYSGPSEYFFNIPCSANLSVHHVRSRLRAFERLWRARKCYIIKENRTAITVAVVVNATAVSATKV